MISTSGQIDVGNAFVVTTSNRGFTPEELVDRAVDKIIYVGKDSHPAIREQAEVFKQQIRGVVLQYLKQAVLSDRTTIANRLVQAGHPELTTLLKE